MISRKNKVSLGVLVFCLLTSVGCQLLYTEGQKPSDQAPLYFYVAIDNSISYGLPKAGRRPQGAPSVQAVFSDAKTSLYRQLITPGVFQADDRLVGISPFTDEPVGGIENEITGGAIEIGTDKLGSLSTIILDNLDKVQLRPLQGGADYKTYYRNVFDQARNDFQNLKATPDQQLCILLTDERGSEIEGAPELLPEKYSSYYVIKLEAKAEGHGKLAVTPNEKLAKVAGQKDNIAAYVTSIRNQYKTLNQVPVQQLNWLRIGLLALILAGLAFIWPLFAKRLGRDWRWRRQGQSLLATYNPSNGKILLRPQGFQLPAANDHYFLDKGGAFKSLNPKEGWIEPMQPLPPDRYEITVVPEDGQPRKATFVIGKSLQAPPSLKANYKASANTLFLTAHYCQLPKAQAKYELDEMIEIERLSPDDGEIVYARPLQAGSHKITVILDDGRKVTATFHADPPPLPQPKYFVSIARYSDIGNSWTVELTGREVSLLEQQGLKTSIWAKRDDHYLYIRTAGRVQTEDGTPIMGSLQLSLGTMINTPLLLELEDDTEDIEITVRQS